jgi:hypothetical protein
MPDNADKEYWIREGFKDEYLKRWVVDLIYSDGGPDEDFMYAIYLDEDLSIQWFFKDQTPGKVLPPERFFPKDFGLILTDVVHLETLSEGLRLQFRDWLHWAERDAANGKAAKKDAQGESLKVKDVSSAVVECDFSRLRRQQTTLRASRRLIAEALSRAIEDYPPPPPPSDPNQPRPADPRSEAARSALQKAQEYVKGRSSDRGRKNVLAGAMMGLMLCLLLLGFFNYAYTQASGVAMASLGPDTPVEELSKAAANAISWKWISAEGWDVIKFSLIGSLGAMLSLLMGASTRQYDAGAGQTINMIEGASRIIVGVLGAAFITLGIKSKFLLGFMTIPNGADSSDTVMWLQFLLGFAAGMSERLVPSFVSIVESQVQTGSKPQ